MTTPGNAASHGLLGIWRLCLTLSVALGYLGPDHAYLIPQAVFLSILLSGYVIVPLLMRAYLPFKGGLWLYYRQRAKRIYLPYLLILPFALGMAYADSYITSGVQGFYYYLPPLEDADTLSIWLRNLSIIGVAGIDGRQADPSFIPPLWGVAVVMPLWIIAPGLLLRRWTMRLFGVAALAYTAGSFGLWAGGDARADWGMVIHHGLLSGMLPFAMGMYLGIWRYQRAGGAPWPVGAAALCAYAALLTDIFALGIQPVFWGLLWALALGAIMTDWLGGVDRTRLPYWLSALDHCCGVMAFPLLLVHVPVAAFITWLCPEMYYYFHDTLTYFRPWELFVFSLPLSLGLALAIGYGVEVPLSARRKAQRAAQLSVTTPT